VELFAKVTIDLVAFSREGGKAKEHEPKKKGTFRHPLSNCNRDASRALASIRAFRA
jgi:hypothetical protein